MLLILIINWEHKSAMEKEAISNLTFVAAWSETQAVATVMSKQRT